MNNFIKSAASLLLVSIAFAFSSCEDDDGTIISLNEAAKYGNIKVTFEGTRPDGEDFTATQNFRFTSFTGPTYYSTVESDGDEFHYFEVQRFYGPINESQDGEENYALLTLYADESGEEPSFSDSQLRIETSIITKDKKFFYINENINISSEDVTSYSYNQNTGKLTLKFAKTLPSGLDVTVSISVTVFEELFEG